MPTGSRLPFPYRPEADIARTCLHELGGALDWAAARRLAGPWVQAVRDQPPPFWALERLLHEYPISSGEGLALMRLAEALLRVPDVGTAMTLTADQLGRADFSAGNSGVLPRVFGVAMELARKLLPHEEEKPGLDVRLGGPAIVAAALRALQLLGRQFVLGQDMAQAMHAANAQRRQHTGLRFSYDMLGEGARTSTDALRNLQRYRQAIDAIAGKAQAALPCASKDGISIKLSALHPRYEDAQRARVTTELVPLVWQLCELAAAANINLTIDAEEVERLELSLDVFEALAEKVAWHCPQWPGLGLALQAYQTRAPELVQHVVALARRHRLHFMCRLVKGAYWDAEIKRAQELGLPHYPVFTHKHLTDLSYLACARALLDASDVIYPQFATHNAGTIAALVGMVQGTDDACEMQRLYGMGEGIYREVLKDTHITCRVYAPVGAHRDLLAYLVRRLLENGANSSFVHQLVDAAITPEMLLASPLHVSAQPALPLPAALYGAARRNSAGVDLSVATMRAPLLQACADLTVPIVPLSDPARAPACWRNSAAAYPQWSARPVSERAAILRRAADAMEQQLPKFCALLVKEARKTWGDAVAEVREAVDFLRYYAAQAEAIMQPVALPGPSLGITGETNALHLKGRGVWVCISPWNFPLAIFTGQVAAALVTGNTVLAKPAEQTPAIACEAVALLHAAGVPEDVLQLLHGRGETVGAALVALPGIAGVVFTGSTEVAKIIQRALAAKAGPIQALIAETGGINAMVADSTALPEQVVDAVVQSAFRSAGQRCSALRLLCVHESIADTVIEMIRGAVQELSVGDPGDLATDVGPVIDSPAFDDIARHVRGLQAHAKPIFDDASAARVPDSAIPNLVMPTAFEVQSVAGVKAEIFGPVLQIVRWRGDPLQVIGQINALGFGLTLGIQTRIDARAQAMAAAAHVGNVYINRNMIGAVVGVQPFGGEGLSGTGPKAGGPHYLYRFCAEQTVTVNTTAAGGNAALLARA